MIAPISQGNSILLSQKHGYGETKDVFVRKIEGQEFQIKVCNEGNDPYPQIIVLKNLEEFREFFRAVKTAYDNPESETLVPDNNDLI